MRPGGLVWDVTAWTSDLQRRPFRFHVNAPEERV
jgi:hypothetical protein